jgi:hypothetical protein
MDVLGFVTATDSSVEHRWPIERYHRVRVSRSQ